MRTRVRRALLTHLTTSRLRGLWGRRAYSCPNIKHLGSRLIADERFTRAWWFSLAYHRPAWIGPSKGKSVGESTREELLARISEYRERWAGVDDIGPYEPREFVEKLWRDMRKLGLSPPIPPDIPRTADHFRQKDFDEWNRKRHRQFHEALNAAEQTLRADANKDA